MEEFASLVAGEIHLPLSTLLSESLETLEEYYKYWAEDKNSDFVSMCVEVLYAGF